MYVKRWFGFMFFVLSSIGLFGEEGATDHRALFQDMKAVKSWNSFLGSIHRGLNHHGHKLSQPWVFGLTGQAFMTIQDREVCPGPYNNLPLSDTSAMAELLGLRLRSLNPERIEHLV